jgi:hypothetical protein
MNKVHRKNLSTTVIPPVFNLAQNKVTSDDIVSVLDCVDENLSEVESGDSDSKIGDNQESDGKSGTSGSEQNDVQVAPVVSGWCGVKWQRKSGSMCPPVA